MQLLLTSAGVTNASIREAFIDLLGKPIHEASALCIPTALHARPELATHAQRFVSGTEPRTPMCELGWKSLGILELSAMSETELPLWHSALESTDALLVSGGDALFLHYWMRKSGLAELVSSLERMVYVGLSAGSMVLTPRIGQEFVAWKAPTGSDQTLGLVDFCLFPHLNHPDLPENSAADAQRWAKELGAECFAIDDQTAIGVREGRTWVISEGAWLHFPP